MSPARDPYLYATPRRLQNRKMLEQPPLRTCPPKLAHYKTPLLAHRCHAPWSAGRIEIKIDIRIVPAFQAHLDHHRVCPTCAHRLGLTPLTSCITSDWHDPDPDHLCAEGRRLLAVWTRAICTLKEPLAGELAALTTPEATEAP